MKYYDFAKYLEDKYEETLKSVLPILNSAMWELKGENPGVVADTDIPQLEEIFVKKIKEMRLGGWAGGGSGSPCPVMPSGGNKLSSEQKRNQSSLNHSASQDIPGRKLGYRNVRNFDRHR